VLAAANDLYLKGGEHMPSGLALFDRERCNIETGQAWAAGCEAEDLTASLGLPASIPRASPMLPHLRAFTFDPDDHRKLIKFLAFHH